MAVVENAGVGLRVNGGSSSSDVAVNGFETVTSESSSLPNDQEPTKAKNFHGLSSVTLQTSNNGLHNADNILNVSHRLPLAISMPAAAKGVLVPKNGMHESLIVAHQNRSNGLELHENGHVEGEGGDGFKRDMKELADLLSKLNPMAEEFVPGSGVSISNKFLLQSGGDGNGNYKRKKNYIQGKRRMNSRTSMAQREEVIGRTVYVSDIDQQVTEEQLAALFSHCGHVVDCRVCGDPNSVLRFAFIEFFDEEGARAALNLAGTVLGFYPVKVLPSKTAIAPVNPSFLPRTEDEREMCARTIYCTNIDKKVSQSDVKLFFETLCGQVYRLRLLGDYHHSTRIAFVEFVLAESAITALNCSGAVLGSLAIRVSPSKTPVRPRAPRPPMH